MRMAQNLCKSNLNNNFVKKDVMEELLIKLKDEKESFFLKELWGKLKIKFESINNDDSIYGEKFKQTVIKGKEAYKKVIWTNLQRLTEKIYGNKPRPCFFKEDYRVLERVQSKS